jgi:hypothetical protein
LLRYIQKNTLQTAPVSDAPVSVGTVRVASAKKGLGVAHLSKHVRLAMREVMARFEDVSWGAIDSETAGVFSQQFYTTTQLTDQHSFTSVEGGIRTTVAARVAGGAVATTLKQVEKEADAQKATWKDKGASPEESKKLKAAFMETVDEQTKAVKEVVKAWGPLRLSEATASASATILHGLCQTLDPTGVEALAHLTGPMELHRIASDDAPRKRGRDDSPGRLCLPLDDLCKALKEAPPPVSASQLFLSVNRKKTKNDKEKLERKRDLFLPSKDRQPPAIKDGTRAHTPMRKPLTYAAVASKGARR